MRPKKVKIVEVGARDGLQNESIILNAQVKAHYIELLAASGLKTIEATSFVSPKAIPQMANALEVFSKVKHLPVELPCLVPNMKGMDNAIRAGVKHIALFSATSDTFTQKNINASVKESFKRMTDVAALAQKESIKMRGYISTAFGCPYEGKISKEALRDVLDRFLDLGVYEVSIGDTIGVATPEQVEEYLSHLSSLEKVALHFHDTRGMGLANVLVSLRMGISVFDSSSAGLGGCPYAKGASGNLATEDLLYLLHSMNIKTGVDLDKVITASDYILNQLSKPSPSKFFNAYKASGY